MCDSHAFSNFSSFLNFFQLPDFCSFPSTAFLPSGSPGEKKVGGALIQLPTPLLFYFTSPFAPRLFSLLILNTSRLLSSSHSPLQFLLPNEWNIGCCELNDSSTASRSTTKKSIPKHGCQRRIRSISKLQSPDGLDQRFDVSRATRWYPVLSQSHQRASMGSKRLSAYTG